MVVVTTFYNRIPICSFHTCIISKESYTYVCYDFRTERCIYLQLFAIGHMSYLRYLCFFAYSGVQCILFCLSSSCVPYVASFSRFVHV
jgi:hypothetical protein